MSSKSFFWHIAGTLLLCIGVTFCITWLFSTKEDDPKRSYPLCTILPASWEFADSVTASFVGYSGLLWDRSSEIRIWIMDGPEDARKKVLRYASTWANYSGLQFRRVYSLSDQPQIRISFNCTGYNSLVGKQALDISFKGKPTMCLQALDRCADEEVFKRTVLHEFGHVMGLLHELQNPSASIPWDTSKLYKYYKDTFNWDPDSVNKWVLQPYSDADYSVFDPHSIMLYAVPKTVTKNGFEIAWPKSLSPLDIQYLQTNYH